MKKNKQLFAMVNIEWCKTKHRAQTLTHERLGYQELRIVALDRMNMPDTDLYDTYVVERYLHTTMDWDFADEPHPIWIDPTPYMFEDRVRTNQECFSTHAAAQMQYNAWLVDALEERVKCVTNGTSIANIALA